MTPPSAAITLTLPGAPRTKKTHSKIIRVRGRPMLIPSEAWTDWKNGLRALAPALLRGTEQIEQPVNCCALFYRDANRGDAVGYYQGLADVLEHLAVVDDDKRIVAWDGSRLLIDRANPRVEITLTPIEGKA